MGMKKLKNRNEMPDDFKWKIEDMYPSYQLWEEDLKIAENKAAEFVKLKGSITSSAENFEIALKSREEIWQKIEKAFVFSRMKLDEDNRISRHQAMLDRVQALIAKLSASMAFFVPEILQSDEDKVMEYIDNKPELQQYKFSISTILREKAHILSEQEENIIARFGEISDAPHSIFNMLNNADISFGEIEDENGDITELTHGNYITFMESHNREVRKAAYTRVYETYKGLINTISTAYSFNVKGDVVSARIRKYDSPRQMALSGGNIAEEVYDNLISVVHEYLPVLHRYIELRKRILGLSELKMYDIYVPLIELPKREIPFNEAVKLMKEGLAPLGSEYIAQVQKGVDAGWIDIYENQGKTSGAYSFGSYDSMPYILMNYTDTLKDVFTLVHEMGHSMHSYYTRSTQPFTYGDHSIFTAEVASTVNESLLIKHLINKETDIEMKKYLINFYIEEFRTTLFRQTMFAEFEQLAHQAAMDGIGLTSRWLNETYNHLNSEYFGDALSEDEWIQYEWSRIPHFYRSFYVYQYATGFSAATAISKKILEGTDEDRLNYIKFLKSGSSMDPVDLLKIAGVDMSKPEPVRLAMETFKDLVEKLEELVK